MEIVSKGECYKCMVLVQFMWRNIDGPFWDPLEKEIQVELKIEQQEKDWQYFTFISLDPMSGLTPILFMQLNGLKKFHLIMKNSIISEEDKIKKRCVLQYNPWHVFQENKTNRQIL